MREIKFRGKSIETGEWIYGDLWRREQNVQGTIYTFITHTGGRIERVDPETVGQFTGLSDKNIEEIYEGDIVKIESCYEEKITSIRKVSYILDRFWDGYTLTWEYISGSNDIYCCEDTDFSGYIKKYNSIEIIGNIYSNPELLTK